MLQCVCSHMTMMSEKCRGYHVGGVTTQHNCQADNCLCFGLFQRQKEESRQLLLSGTKIVTNQGEETKILSTERKTWWLAVIS